MTVDESELSVDPEISTLAFPVQRMRLPGDANVQVTYLRPIRYREHPTTEQILRLFSHTERHKLTTDGKTVQVFDAKLTDLQHQIINLLGVAPNAFRSPAVGQ